MRIRTSAAILMLLVATLSHAASQQTVGSGTTQDKTAILPENLPDDLTVWPNRISYRNSDDWLWQNHDRIRKMRPRVLVLNFANDVSMEDLRKHVEGIIRATAEATRYHGFKDPGAPAFIEYQVAKYVDLRDRTGPNAGQRVTSSRLPLKKDGKPHEVLCDYGEFHTDDYAKHYGFRDPRDAQRFLNLRELVNSGFVHEMWFYAIHDGPWPGRETCEFKQFYDQNCRPIRGKHGQAGNGADRTVPWIGRSFRIAFFNPHRGIGCAMENLGHTLEWTATTGSIMYYQKYFMEFAELNFDKRFDVPFNELYRTDYAVKDSITYPSKTSMVVKIRDKTYTIDPYIAIAGSVHFPPGARHHYDLDSPYTVSSTIENYRLRNGPDGQDRVADFNRDKFTRYADVAPDCMGQWMIFWRQCMPGLDNQCVDDEGKPMKNWWPFLFY